MFDYSAGKTDDMVKDRLDSFLREEGYTSYAQCLNTYKFLVLTPARLKSAQWRDCADAVAFMMPYTNTICMNYKLFLCKDPTNDSINEQLKHVSVILRHEILHFILLHQREYLLYLKKKYPDHWKKLQSLKAVHDRQNTAADWDLSRYYTEEDKKIAKQVQYGDRIIGGLVLELDKPEWKDLTYDELLDKLLGDIPVADLDRMEKEEREKKEKPKTIIERESHSKEYKDTYNDIIRRFNDRKYSDEELAELIDKVARGEKI